MFQGQKFQTLAVQLYYVLGRYYDRLIALLRAIRLFQSTNMLSLEVGQCDEQVLLALRIASETRGLNPEYLWLFVKAPVNPPGGVPYYCCLRRGSCSSKRYRRVNLG